MQFFHDPTLILRPNRAFSINPCGTCTSTWSRIKSLVGPLGHGSNDQSLVKDHCQLIHDNMQDYV